MRFLKTHRFIDRPAGGAQYASGDQPKNKNVGAIEPRMFDNRFSFPTTSEQVLELQAESDAEGRSAATSILAGKKEASRGKFALCYDA